MKGYHKKNNNVYNMDDLTHESKENSFHLLPSREGFVFFHLSSQIRNENKAVSLFPYKERRFLQVSYYPFLVLVSLSLSLELTFLFRKINRQSRKMTPTYS